MKKIMLICAVMTISVCSMAQVKRAATPSKQRDTATGNMQAGNKMEKKEMFRELNLTKEQRGKLKSINQESKSKKEAISNDEKLGAAEKKQQLKMLKQQQMKDIQAILTPEQLAKFKELRNANKAKGAPEEMDN